jgi:FRG domain
MKYGILEEYWKQQEAIILRIFQRKSHLFIPNPPSGEDSFEWRSLMQHHGTPTRLLDFTWSPYVAAFFALQSAYDEAVYGLSSRPGYSMASLRPFELIRALHPTIRTMDRRKL